MKTEATSLLEAALSRTEWFDYLCTLNPSTIRHSPYVSELIVEDNELKEMQTAAFDYIASCCNHAAIAPPSRNDHDLGQRLENIIDQIPNITPNGILLPKVECNFEFNQLHIATQQWFESLAIEDQLHSVFTPLTLRLSRGKPKGEYANRPYATTKIHIDSWAGDPADSVAIHVPLFGDVENTTVAFYETEAEPPLHHLRWLKDFEQGLKALGDTSLLPAQPRIGSAIFFDNCAPHQTVKKGGTTRVSLEFRVRRRLSSGEKRAVEALCDVKRCENYQEYSQWSEIGKRCYLYFDETMEDALNGIFSSNPYSLDLYQIKRGKPKKLPPSDGFDFPKKVSLDDFARHHGVPNNDISENCAKQLQTIDSRYRELSQTEHDHHFKAVQDVIDQKTSRGTEENQQRFESGWGEVLLRCQEQDLSRETLRPQYVKPFDIIRYDGRFIKPANPFLFQELQEISLDHLFEQTLEDYDHVYEFGCGTGRNLFRLAELFPKKHLHGFDWTQATVDLLHLMATKGLNIDGQKFDMLQPDSLLHVEPNSALITIDSMEQIGDKFEPFLEFLLTKNPSLVMHYEPIVENYNIGVPLDVVAAQYHRKRGYLEGYLSRLRTMESRGILKIMESFRTGYGDPWNEGTSVIIWKPI